MTSAGSWSHLKKGRIIASKSGFVTGIPLTHGNFNPFSRSTSEKNISGRWLSHPLKNMKVSWDYYSQYMEKTCSKPPTRYFQRDFMSYPRAIQPDSTHQLMRRPCRLPSASSVQLQVQPSAEKHQGSWTSLTFTGKIQISMGFNDDFDGVVDGMLWGFMGFHGI